MKSHVLSEEKFIKNRIIAEIACKKETHATKEEYRILCFEKTLKLLDCLIVNFLVFGAPMA